MSPLITCATCGQQETNAVQAAGAGWGWALNAVRCNTCVRRFPAWLRKHF